jgi:hypothetical protein
MPAELEPTSRKDYDEIDEVIDRACRTHGWTPVIPQYKRSMRWAWQQWEYTITERLWKTAAYNMLVPFLLLLYVHWTDPASPWWKLSKSHNLHEPLLAVASGWNYMLTLATFVTTFFVGHSHDFWRKSYGLTRTVQGRLNDLGLICSAHASRTASGGLTKEAAFFLHENARNLRLMHCLVPPASVQFGPVAECRPQALVDARFVPCRGQLSHLHDMQHRQ